MKIYVEHDATALVALGLAGDLACDGVILRHGAPDDVLASTSRGNPLGGNWLVDATGPGDAIVSWSGTLAPEAFEAHPMNWLRPGREALDRLCDEVSQQLEALGKSLVFHPHSRHVLSDPPSCLAFSRDRAGPFGFALAPADMFEPGMMPDAEDHLTRMFETLGAHCEMVMLRDLQVEADACRAVPLGMGALPQEHVLALLKANVPVDTPVVVLGERIDMQIEWLGG